MKKRKLAVTAAILLIFRSVPVVSAAPESALLDVSGFSIMDENLVYLGADYLNPADVLFDDQDKVPVSPDQPSVDKALWDATDRSKNWKPNWQAEFGDDSFYMDLGANYVITGLCFLDTNGVQDWKIEDGEPFAWNTLGSFTTDAYQTWRGITVEKPRSTRYLRFSTSCGDSGVSELALYGYQESELTAAQLEKTTPPIGTNNKIDLSAGQRIGFNAFIDDPMTAIMAAGNIREYHNLSWLLAADGKVKFTQGTWGDMDSYYAAMKERGISIIPCFQGGSSAITKTEKPPEIPVPVGADTTDPASYTMHAQAMFQVAARYGSNTDIDPSALNVADGSEPRTGLGLLRAVENANEPNKTWSGKANYFTPYELAAMCSADYDGHEGTIPNAGVKQADPDFRLAIGGLLNTASVLDYLSEMKLWFDYHRTDGKFAADIINIHLGPDTTNPDDSALQERIREIKKWIDDNAPYSELWISEFEVPMNDCEQEGVDAHDDENYQLHYAERVARTYLLGIGAGADRMTKFQLRDEGPGVYYNSGLVTQKGEWSKKKAWYYTACMTNILRDTYFAADMTDSAVKKYFFINKKCGDSIYALWLPTNTGQVIKNCKIVVPETANVYLTVPGSCTEGVTTKLTVTNGTVEFTATETPVFMTISSHNKEIVNGKFKRITPQAICMDEGFSGTVCDLSSAPQDSNLNQFYRMFDEPNTMPEYLYGDTAALQTPQTNVKISNKTCYVKLQQPYILDGFGVYDTYGTGRVQIYDAKTDTLLWETNLGSYMTRSMDITEDSEPTDLLRIICDGGELNEFALYGYPAGGYPDYDCNADGCFDKSDAASLQAWLLTKQNDLANWTDADRTADLTLDARDLTRMKQALINK